MSGLRALLAYHHPRVTRAVVVALYFSYACCNVLELELGSESARVVLRAGFTFEIAFAADFVASMFLFQRYPYPISEFDLESTWRWRARAICSGRDRGPSLLAPESVLVWIGGGGDMIMEDEGEEGGMHGGGVSDRDGDGNGDGKKELNVWNE